MILDLSELLLPPHLAQPIDAIQLLLIVVFTGVLKLLRNEQVVVVIWKALFRFLILIWLLLKGFIVLLVMIFFVPLLIFPDFKHLRIPFYLFALCLHGLKPVDKLRDGKHGFVEEVGEIDIHSLKADVQGLRRSNQGLDLGDLQIGLLHLLIVLYLLLLLHIIVCRGYYLGDDASCDSCGLSAALDD